MNDVLRSKRFASAVITGIVGVLVVLVPDLETNADALIELLMVIVGLLVGGYTVVDVAQVVKTGVTKYDTPQDNA